ncbi:hypothetical protein JTE90_014218 [Oedothorax gibbosus]|uniref:Uncharacterized protein n=1 Tax=Oedothorax gibbosus TaxID=931172 RepID=A0AAV6TDG6_9ARAC|nr:hypothetical protein JTE90_014218 [Oedothorax gibbosus]
MGKRGIPNAADASAGLYLFIRRRAYSRPIDRRTLLESLGPCFKTGRLACFLDKLSLTGGDTCLLSVSRKWKYLALVGVTTRLGALPSNPTPRRIRSRIEPSSYGLAPNLGKQPRSRGLAQSPSPARSLLNATFPHLLGEEGIRRGASPGYSPLLRNPCAFFSPLLLCLKSGVISSDLRST